MEGNSVQYFVRRKLGSPIGPFTPIVLATMLKKGTLDGSEEISLDRRTWRPVKELDRPPAPAPKAGGTFDDEFGAERPPASAEAGTSQEALDLGAPDAAPLELDADDLMPLELAPLAPSSGKSSEKPSEKASAKAAPDRSLPHEVSAPVAMLLSGQDPLALHGGEAPGSVPLLPTIRVDTVDGGDDAAGPQAAARPGSPAGAPGIRHRTMSAVRQRPLVEAHKASGKMGKTGKIAVAATAAAASAAIAIAALGATGVLAREPKVDAVLGPVAAEIDRDRFGAYEQGARLLGEAAAARPKSVRLRAAAAELLASSVVLRRGDRARIHKAEAILADIGDAAARTPELSRARAWIALAKGNVKEARRLAG